VSLSYLIVFVSIGDFGQLVAEGIDMVSWLPLSRRRMLKYQIAAIKQCSVSMPMQYLPQNARELSTSAAA
jgi:hypothetical protein